MVLKLRASRRVQFNQETNNIEQSTISTINILRIVFIASCGILSIRFVSTILLFLFRFAYSYVCRWFFFFCSFFVVVLHLIYLYKPITYTKSSLQCVSRTWKKGRRKKNVNYLLVFAIYNIWNELCIAYNSMFIGRFFFVFIETRCQQRKRIGVRRESCVAEVSW